jgi:hypothetical protein
MKTLRRTVILGIGIFALLSLVGCTWSFQSETADETVNETEESATNNPTATPQIDNFSGNDGQASLDCTNRFEITGPVNIAVNQEFQPGDTFQAEWSIENTGTCVWNMDYSVVLISGEALGVPSPVPLSSAVSPGDVYELTIQMTAPQQAGSYSSLWRLQSGDGETFGKDSPANAPLRVVIKVVGAAAATPEPTSTPTPTGSPPTNGNVTINPYPFVDALSKAMGETMQVNQCFNLVSGEVISCAHAHANFKYTYASQQGGNLLPWNELEFSSGRESLPSQEDCETETYYGLTLQLALPAESSTGKFYCFHTEYDGDVVYGMVQPTDFNAGGLTFNYITYEPGSGSPIAKASAVPNLNLFVMLQMQGVTLMDEECYDLTTGQEVSCGSADASFRYNHNSYYGGILEAKPAIEFADAVTSQPSKMSCMGSTYIHEAAITLDSYAGDVYVCFETEFDGDTVYGWLHPTHYNTKGITFDFVLYEP